MNCFLLTLYLKLLLDSVFGSLPAPVNVSMNSVNFHHVLRWDPGPGSPPGTSYLIFKRMKGRKPKEPQKSTKTSLTLKLKNEGWYYLNVQASYNQTLSPMSSTVTFNAYENTKIGPPKLSLAGCGNCIHINISLPKVVQDFYKDLLVFRVSLKKPNEPLKAIETRNKSVTLELLQKGQEYCVQVEAKCAANLNTEPSAWTCTFTSIVEPRRVGVVVGIAAALLLVVISLLVSFMLCLYYTGFICKLKETLPRPLIVRDTILVSGGIMTLERTIPVLITITSETDKQLPATRATSSGEEEEEDDEEEEEEGKAYVNRFSGCSSSESSCRDSCDVLGSRTLAASVRLPSEVEEVDAEESDHEGLDQYKPFIPEVKRHVTGEEEKEEEEEEEEDMKEVCHSSGNINLFSVTLAALAVGEEEEEETTKDFLKLSDMEPLMLTRSKRTLSHTDSQTKSDDKTLTPPTPEDFNERGYEDRRGHTSSGCLKASDGETQEEEEEEESSGYMGRAHT
ncbi:hypothetical protein PAMA_003601 [Pampus argenteus]